MIKKSMFEDDIISGMERELHAQHTQQSKTDVVKAASYLHSAADILDKAGFTSKAASIRGILSKLAEPSHKQYPAQEMPAIHALMEAGLTQKDLGEFTKGNPVAKAKVNQILRGLGRTDKEIMKFLGERNYVSEDDAEALLDPGRNLGKMWEWMQNPQSPIDPMNPRPEEGEETELMKDWSQGKPISVSPPKPETFEITPIDKPSPISNPEGEELVFKRMAQAFQEAKDEADARHKKKNPLKPSDPHTKGLTPEKMVENYKRHGIPFNMADDGLLDAEVVPDNLDAEDDSNLEMDFEDEI